MGSSSPPKQIEQLQLTLNINMDPNTLKKSIEKDSDDVAPAPVSSFSVNAQAKDKEGKEIPLDVKINADSLKNNEKNSTHPSESGESNSSYNQNIDNNIARNKESNNNFSVFTAQNTDEYDKKNNIDKNIDINIDKNIDKNIDRNKSNNNYNIINDKNNNNNNINDNNNNQKIINEKNNFLKEGVEKATKFGEEESDEKKYDNHQTPVGENIDMNIPKNKYEKNNELLINNKTPINEDDEIRNIDVNEGSNFNKDKDEKEDNYLGLNYSKGDLSLSQTVYMNNDDSLENSIQLIQKGYLPIFIKLNNYEPLLLHIKEEGTLTSLVKAYIQSCPETDKGLMTDIKLYHEKRFLDINTPVKYLSLGPFSIVTNKMQDNYTNKS